MPFMQTHMPGTYGIWCMSIYRYLYPYNDPKIGKNRCYKNQVIMGK